MNSHFESRLLGNKEWSWAYDKVFIKPNIPPKKLMNALSYAAGVLPEEVLLLIDDTVFGGAKEGVLLTSSAIYGHEFMEPIPCVFLADIEDIGMVDTGQIHINRHAFFKGTIVDHAVLQTITSRINHVLKELKAGHPNNEQSSGNAPSQESPANFEASRQPLKAYQLNFIASDGLVTEVKKYRNLSKATTVAGFLLFGGDGGDATRPMSKITDEFISTVHQCLLEFRKIVVEKNGCQGFANDIATLDVVSYVANRLIKEVSQYNLPDTVIMALMKVGVPGSLFIDLAKAEKLLFPIISIYFEEDEPLPWFCARLYINNQESKFLVDHSHLVGQYVMDIDSGQVIKGFESFSNDVEGALTAFDKFLQAHARSFAMNVLNVAVQR